MLWGIVFPSGVKAQLWQEKKSEHFVIQYQKSSDYMWAGSVLRQAENYYRIIADQIGYQRYKKFWTWEDRVRIIIYPNQETFSRETNQPAWSKGGVIRDKKLFLTKTIISFKQEDNFLDGVLPHEISHLVLRDAIGFDKPIGIWFDEGMAQLQEKSKREIAKEFMRRYLVKNKPIPLNVLLTKGIRLEIDPIKVSLFYAQSISVVDFLMTKYGRYKFSELCRNLREGKNFQQALKSSYPVTFEKIGDLEKKWLSYMNY